jgi:hypothetical protein
LLATRDQGDQIRHHQGNTKAKVSSVGDFQPGRRGLALVGKMKATKAAKKKATSPEPKEVGAGRSRQPVGTKDGSSPTKTQERPTFQHDRE